MQKIAIFGGTFDPVHWGHLLIAETALTQARLDQVLWVPSYQPPHKSHAEAPLSYCHRLKMVELAVADHPNFKVSAVERTLTGVSYAVETFKALQVLHPDTEWFWIIGIDAFQSLPRWYGHQALIETCDWLVAPRLRLIVEPETVESETVEPETIEPETVCEEVVQKLATQSLTIRWQRLQMPLINISSSLVRDYCRRQHSIRYLVSEPVRSYILTHSLYQTA